MKDICPQCGKEFEFNDNQLKTRKKQPDKPIFCSRQCSGRYYANKQHNEETIEQKKQKAKKISNTLKLRETILTDEQKQQRIDNLNNYWLNITSEERSNINKKSAVKSKQTKLERYGDSNYNNREKAKQTNLAVYGVENTYRTEKAINKAKAVIQEKYGVDYFFSNRQKYREVSLAKYGVEHPMKNKDVKEKLSNTKFINWGDSNYNNQEKFEKTFLEKYGVTRPFYKDEFKEKSKQTKLERYGNINYNNREKALETIYEKYGKDFYEEQLSNLGSRISKVNKEFADYINADSFEYPIGKYSYDLKKGDILIEIDPTFTHNSYEHKLFNRFGGLDKFYHSDKSKIALNVGFSCIHVFDWDNWGKIKYLLQDKETLYARNLEIREVSMEDTAQFLISYHLQNSCNGQNIRLGLYKGDELIEIMTFGRPRYNKNYDWELLRLCTKAEYKVVGGAEKLFKHFIDVYKPEGIISYCDFSKFSGEVYTRLGFKQKGNPKPSKHWSRNAEHITDNLLRQRGYDQLFNANYGKGTSNEELMLENGWLPIYDCGQITFIWKKEV